MFSQINVRKKSQSTWYLYIQTYICYQVYKDDIKFKTQSRQKTQEKHRKTKQSRLLKGQISNTDLIKPV